MPEEEAIIPEQDLVVVEHEDWRGKQGGYGLVRASEWCSDSDPVMFWRGPEKPDERVDRENLREISCKTLLVDEAGFYVCKRSERLEFYPCPQIREEIESEVLDVARKILDETANERTAESWSYVDLERLGEVYGEEVFAVATFGDAIAVNGELALDPKHAKPPKGWVLTEEGGTVPGGEEATEDTDWVVEAVSRELKDKIPAWIVERVIDAEFAQGKNYIAWSSDSGETEVWVSKRAMRKVEGEERAREAEKERREEERRRKEEAERREKIKKGGWPSPREWSPRGKLPGE